MSSPLATSSDVLHISTKFDDTVHEYQFARSTPQLFAVLQQLTAAKYPLTTLYFHYSDEDGDMVRVTSEAELREAVGVCGPRLNLVLSSGLPSSSSSSFSSSTPKPSIASATAAPHTSSPSPSLASASSPLQPSSVIGEVADGEVLDDIDSYLSSDEEELFEQARSQVRSQQLQHSAASAHAKEEAEVKSPRYGVVALDSEDEGEEEDARFEDFAAERADAVQTSVAEVAAEVAPAVSPAVEVPEPAAEPAPASAAAAVSDSGAGEANKNQSAVPVQDEIIHSVQLPTPASTRTEPLQSASESKEEAKAKEKADEEDSVEAVNARLRAFYQLDEQRRAIVDAASSPTSPAPPMRPSSPVPVATLFTSFFAEAVVIATIRDNAALLTPLMTSSTFPLFLHHLCLLNPALSAHPLARYTFAVSSLHPFTVCAHCSASPVVGRLLCCRDCDATLCGTCEQQAQHPAEHRLAELPLPEYRRESVSTAATYASVAASASAPRVDEGGRVLEERKASDFAELGDRVRAGGQRVWKQGAVSLRKVDEMLTQFAADIKRMIDGMLDGVFSDAPKQHSAQPAADDEHKQAAPSPHSRQQSSPRSCSTVRRPQCLPASRPPVAQAVEMRVAGVALAQPARQNMSAAESRVEARPAPQAQQASAPFAYRAQLDVLGDMGLITSAVQEETCKELLTASKGNVEQAVQWLMDKINV